MMINIQEVIIHLQKKITQYRYQQKRSNKAKAYLQIGRQVLTSINHDIKHNVLHSLNSYANTVMNNVIELQQYAQQQMHAQKASYQQKIDEMQSEISRQRKLITDMKKEVQDLQELIFIQNSQRYQEEQIQKQQPQQPENKSPHSQTINGLEIIEEEETDRTILSSARSINHDNFIRIQQKDQNQEEQNAFYKKSIPQFQPIQPQMMPSASSQFSNNQQSYQEQWQQQKSSIYKFEPFMQSSNFSKRQHTFNSQCGENQYESLPLSMEGYYTKQLTMEHLKQDANTWEEKLCSSAELKDITNNDKEISSERQRQSKSKMFLQQFRKTFNKCLSSANVSRKTSAKLQKSSNKTATDRGDKKSHRQTNKNDNEGHDNKKLINEMLRDIDNNNKFSVGNRRNQLKYQGQRKDNTRHGHGTLYYLNGLCYQGQFKNNMRQGYGILKFNQIQIYRGQWNADELSGQGKIRNFAVINKKKSQNNANSPLLKWVSYCGYFKNNRFEGEGTLYLQGAEKFLGKFICGMACGQGTLYRKNGEIETGIWRNNQLVQQF